MARHDDDDDAFDERGILRDGKSVRVIDDEGLGQPVASSVR